MDSVLKIVNLGRACRNESNIKTRQPIGKMYVGSTEHLPSDFIDIVAEELNVKDVIFTNDATDFISYSFKPQMRTLGPKYGKLLNNIRTALTELNGTQAMDELNSTGVLKLTINGDVLELSKDDLLISTAQKDGFVAQSEGGFTTVIDTELSNELIEEGFVREIISKIQTMRKEAGFEVQDNIVIGFANNDVIANIIQANQAIITHETLAVDVTSNIDSSAYVKEWKVNNEVVTFGVSKVASEALWEKQ